MIAFIRSHPWSMVVALVVLVLASPPRLSVHLLGMLAVVGRAFLAGLAVYLWKTGSPEQAAWAVGVVVLTWEVSR